MKQDDPEISASQDPDSEARARKRRLKNTRKWLWGVIFLTTMISGSMLWGMESWMLGESLWRIEEWIFFAILAIGGLGLTGLMAGLGSGKHRLRHAILALVITVAIAGGMRWIGGELALSRLFRSDELTGTYTAMPETLEQRLVQWLENKHIGVPAWLKSRESKDRLFEYPPRMHRLVSYSRWSVRREFVRRMLMDETRAAYLVEKWYECFPAVTGQDVDLARRRDLMEMFRTIRENSSLSEKSRQAATLWMGLVFLSDPVEFSRWREPLRDAMLGIPDPMKAEHHDCWMRVLDTLLAYDPPASWPVATQSLTSNPKTLRRAVRERVRGVMSHFDAVVREFNASERAADWDGAFALWQDTGRWLAVYPGTTGEDRIKQWRQTTMFEWLKMDGLGTKWDDLFRGNEYFPQGEYLMNLAAEDTMELSPEQEAVLYAKACDWAEKAVALSEKATVSEGQSEAHVALEHVRVLHPFLNSTHQKDLVRRITPALIRPAVYTRSYGGFRKMPLFETCMHCRRLLERSWHEIPPDQLKTLAKNTRPLMSPNGSGSWLLCFDAWSDTPEFSDEERLLYSIAYNVSWRVMPPDTPKNLVEIIPLSRLPVPPVKEEVVRKVIADLKAASLPSSGGIESNLDRLYPNCPPSPAIVYGLTRKLREMQNGSRKLRSPDFETSMRMELSMSGLIEADDKLLAAITQLAREDPMFHRYFPYQPERHPDLWSDVLKSPLEARQTLVDLMPGSKNDNRLQSLLSSAAKLPPACDVVQAMWQELRERAKVATEPALRPKIYSALFHLAPLLPAKERLAMRSDFLEYFRKTPLPTNAWPDNVMDDIGVYHMFYQYGERIPWENDSLSAALSWSSDICTQTSMFPENGIETKSTGVFSYLTQAMVSYDIDGFSNTWPTNKPIPGRVWKRLPLQPPFEATPWQQARDLHLRRPDLRFPDHAWARPGRK